MTLIDVDRNGHRMYLGGIWWKHGGGFVTRREDRDYDGVNGLGFMLGLPWFSVTAVCEARDQATIDAHGWDAQRLPRSSDALPHVARAIRKGVIE